MNASQARYWTDRSIALSVAESGVTDLIIKVKEQIKAATSNCQSAIVLGQTIDIPKWIWVDQHGGPAEFFAARDSFVNRMQSEGYRVEYHETESWSCAARLLIGW